MSAWVNTVMSFSNVLLMFDLFIRKRLSLWLWVCLALPELL